MAFGAPSNLSLKRFIANEPMVKQLTAARLNAILDYVESSRVQRGDGTFTRQTPGGTTVSVPRKRGNLTSPDFPWKVSIRENPDSPGSFQAMVSEESDLLLSLLPNDKLTVTGLGVWFDFDPGDDLIWIFITVSDQTATEATIQSYGQGNSGFNPTDGAWNNEGGYVQNDGGTPPNQIAANVMLFYSLFNEDGNVMNVQAANTHFVIKNMCIDGFPAQFVQPSPYRRYGVTE